MPHTHIQNFQVRYYECDAYGHMNHINFLRYMQEAAFEASAAAGYDLNRYHEIGHRWLALRTRAEFLKPLLYRDNVQVKTWVHDHRRTRSLRKYEFRLAGSDEVLARGETDWVYRNSNTGRPAAIPTDMLDAFFPEGIPLMAPPRTPFPDPPPQPPGVFKTRRLVEWREIDSMFHVNNAAYMAYVEDCGFKVTAHFGWPVQRMWQEGFGVMLRQHEIEYLAPAHMDEGLEIATWLAEFKRATAVRYFTVTRTSDRVLLAQIRTVWAWVDLDSGRPIRIPESFLRDFAPNISSNIDNNEGEG
jgi:acyl-CoA thioester hydrolase